MLYCQRLFPDVYGDEIQIQFPDGGNVAITTTGIDALKKKGLLKKPVVFGTWSAPRLAPTTRIYTASPEPEVPGLVEDILPAEIPHSPTTPALLTPDEHLYSEPPFADPTFHNIICQNCRITGHKQANCPRYFCQGCRKLQPGHLSVFCNWKTMIHPDSPI
ncbi:hypothetical protein K503DRAFT_806831 [Rhizopogon vinicolor AM-OR11-026]|uniref:CCHC-type domain-containing protein n=1 Tax=Rhizopogon vinicolor AM-OR11-026 TaxID=1314800 RepID=A0A1B7MDP1_9AGAM|nr:hypothetical protein K503DRAFT_806831 [Rhizopogon vinicolor AM-OR11-026]